MLLISWKFLTLHNCTTLKICIYETLKKKNKKSHTETLTCEGGNPALTSLMR